MRTARLSALTALVLSVTGALPLAAPAQATVTDLYVDNGNRACSDTSATAGVQTTPFCTISAAAAIVQPGQTVHISGSGYRQEVDLKRSGTSDAPIVFTGPSRTNRASVGGPDVAHGLTLNGVHDVKLQYLEISGAQGPVVVKDSSRVTLDSGSIEASAGSAPPTTVDYPGVEITGQSSDVTVSRNYITSGFGDGVAVDSGVARTVVTTNLVSNNQGRGVVVKDAPGTVVTSNSIGYDCGPGIELAGSSSGATIENNLLVEGTPNPPSGSCTPASAVDLMVSAASAVGTKADYNAVSPDTRTPYSWTGTSYGDVASFRTASGQGEHDLLDALNSPNGEGDPTIDSADANAPDELATDIDGNPRVDDPTVKNTGTGVGYYDRGAFEFQDPLNADVSGSPANTPGHPLDATLTGSVSSPWGAATVTLDLGDGSPKISQPTFPITHAYPGPGSYPLTLTVTDSLGTTTTVNRGVTIAPIGPIQPNLTVATNESDLLNVDVMSDGSGSPWPIAKDTTDFGDGSPVSPTAAQAPHMYPTPGTYTVTRTVTDDHGRTGSTSKTVTVGGEYMPLATPTRILDTRSGLGAQAKPVGPWSVLKFQVTGRAGVPVDSRITAVLLNLTATDATDATHITAFPGGDLPNASNLNVTPGHDVGNAVLVPVAGDGTVSLYNHSGNVDLIADVQGYFTTQPRESGLHMGVQPVPVRALDTRDGTGGVNGPVGPGGTIKFQVRGPGQLPADAQVAILNLTATDGTDATYVTAAPNGTPPTNSSLNVGPGQTVANQVTVPINPDGTVTLYNHSGNVSLIADLQGYYSPKATTSVVTTAPTRVLDTRTGIGGSSQKLGPLSTVKVKVTGVAGVPASAQAVVVNLTATDPTGPSWLNVYPSGSSVRSTSNINVTPGATVPNLAVVPVGPDGCIEIFNHNGSTDVVVDLQGYTG